MKYLDKISFFIFILISHFILPNYELNLVLPFFDWNLFDGQMANESFYELSFENENGDKELVLGNVNTRMNLYIINGLVQKVGEEFCSNSRNKIELAHFLAANNIKKWKVYRIETNLSYYLFLSKNEKIKYLKELCEVT